MKPDSQYAVFQHFIYNINGRFFLLHSGQNKNLSYNNSNFSRQNYQANPKSSI